MANVNIELGYKNLAWFTANPTIVLLSGQIVYLEQTGTYKIGDGVTQLSVLSFLGISSETQTLQNVTDLGNVTTNNIEANSFIKTGGVSTEFLKADGSVDANTYLTTESQTLQNVTDLGSTTTNAIDTAGITTDYVQLDLTATNTNAVGKLIWNNTDGTLDLGLKGGNVTLQIGQETVARVVNKTGTNITLLESNYQAVRVTGAIGQRPKVDLALANNDLNSATTLGLVTETILNNDEGFINTSGQVREINTTGSLQGEIWADGDLLYLSGTIAGQITNIKPVAPIHTVIIGFVEYAHAIHGKIFVKVNNGYELEELHNVSAIAPNNNEVLTYDLATTLWKPKSVTTALGFTPYNATNPSGYITSSALTGLVPYTGATANVNLGTFTLTTPTINGVSGLLSFKTTDKVSVGNYATPSAQRIFTIGQDTGFVSIGSVVGITSWGGIYLDAITPTTNNYALGGSGTFTSLNSSNIVQIGINNSARILVNHQNISFTPGSYAGGAIENFTFTKPNNTNQTLSTPIIGFNYNGGTRQWATGNITTQSENVWGATTYSFVGASTITNAYGNVFNAPIAGTNATITNNWAAQFNGNVVIGSTGQLIEIKQTTNNPTYVQTGATSSTFTNRSGTRSLIFESYASDINYITSNGAKLAIKAAGATAIGLFTNSIERVVIQSNGNFYFIDGICNMQAGTTTGLKIGTASNEKIAFWNATPIVQPTTLVTASTFVTNTSGILNDTATFDGYTIGQIVKALRNMGLLA